MVEKELNNYSQDFTTETSIRMNELGEKTNTLKEKVNLISKNFIILKEDLEKRVEEMEDKDQKINKNLELLNKSLLNLIQESEKWVRRDEIILIERMLKDFQPLEFVRKKDFEEIMNKSNKEDNRENLERNKNPKRIKEQ